MNYLDYVFIGIIGLCSIIALNRGLIKTIYSFFSLILTTLLAYILYPSVSKILITYTGMYKSLIGKVVKGLNLKLLAENKTSPQDQIELIKMLKVPNFIKSNLLENNNPEVYDLLKAKGIEEYIGGTIATIAINAIAFLFVFIACMFIVKIISTALDLVSKLPVLHQLNKLGGFIVGLLQGLVYVWIAATMLTIFISIKPNESLFLLIEGSMIVKLFYNQSYIVSMITSLSKRLI